MSANYKAVYMPASPDTSAPIITLPELFDCAEFVQGSTASTVGISATYSFRCDDPGFGELPVGPLGVASCTAEVNGRPVRDGEAIDTSRRGDYTLTVTAVDNAGNTRTTSATYHVVDDLPPTLLLLQVH